MPGHYLLDTSALLAHARREPGWAEVQSLFEDEQAALLVASVSLAEFARRLRDLGAGVDEARETTERYASLLGEVVPVDREIALEALGTPGSHP